MKVRFYTTSAGRSPVKDFLLELPEGTRLEVADAIALLDAGRKLEMPLSRNLSSIRPGLHELRFRDKAGQVRIIYYIKRSEAIYLIHGFRKKTQEINRKELDVVLKRLKEI